MGKRIEATLHIAGILVTLAGLLISFVNGDWMPWMLIYGAITLAYALMGSWMLRIWRVRDLKGREGSVDAE